MPSALRPMPVSRTAKLSRTRCPARGSLRTVTTTSPRSVNLTALASRLSRIWRSRVRSVPIGGRNVALEHVGDVELLLGRARADQVERRLDALAQVERMRLDVHPAGLDLREVEDVVDDRQQRVAGVADGRGEVALLVVERRVEQQAAHADHGVHRRADLVAHRRQERALRLVGGLGGGARFLRLLEQARVLDRDHGLVGEGLAAGVISLSVNGLGGWRDRRGSSRCRALPTASARSRIEIVADVARRCDARLRHARAVEHVGVVHDLGACERSARSRACQRTGESSSVEVRRVSSRSAGARPRDRARSPRGAPCRRRRPAKMPSCALAEQALAALEDLLEHRRGVGHRAADHAAAPRPSPSAARAPPWSR